MSSLEGCIQFDWICERSLVMRVEMERRGDERDVRSHERVMVRLDCDFSSIVPATEAHLSFGHFQPRGVTACEQTESRADDNSFGLRRRNDERLPGRLLLDRGLYRAALQPDAPS